MIITRSPILYCCNRLFQVDLLIEYSLTGISVQDGGAAVGLVENFKLSTSTDCVSWSIIQNKGQDRVSNLNSVQKNTGTIPGTSTSLATINPVIDAFFIPAIAC